MIAKLGTPYLFRVQLEDKLVKTAPEYPVLYLFYTILLSCVYLCYEG